MTSNRIAIVLLVAIAVALAALAYRETSWRNRHGLLQPAVASPDGKFVAEVRQLETSELQPYDKVVFLRRDWVPLRSLDAHFVFAGDCQRLGVQWSDPGHLAIRCSGVQAMPTYEDEALLGVSTSVFVER